MKTLSTLIVAGLLSGCSKQSDPRLADLEKRLAKAEYNLRLCETNDFALQAQVDITTRYMQDTAALMQKTMTLATNLQTGMAQLLALTNSPVPAVQRTARALSPAKTSNGIPADVYKTIRAEAERRYPKDWDMQEFVVGQQIEAYRKLHP